MAGAPSMVVGAIGAIDVRACPCLCIDALPLSNSTCHLGLRRSRRQPGPSAGAVELSSAFVSGGAWHGRRLLARKQQRKRKGFVVVDELGGQYEDGFEDVHLHLMNYFTYKAVRTVLHQVYEMNPPKYMWFYNFVAANNPKDGKYFLRALGKEHQELAERVMITRLHLYGKWIKKCDHAKMYQRISGENLELMRERLMETVIWPSDDANMDTIS